MTMARRLLCRLNCLKKAKKKLKVPEGVPGMSLVANLPSLPMELPIKIADLGHHLDKL